MKPLVALIAFLIFTNANAACADDLHLDFSGKALSLVKERPESRAGFIYFSKGFIEGKFFEKSTNEESGCELYEPATRFYEIDIDDDGVPEGLVGYTIEGCGGGNNWSRLIEIFKENSDTWKHAGTIQLGGSPFGSSTITNIRYGILVVGNNDKGDPMFDGAYSIKDDELVKN